jgi:hypothetical protein
MGVQNHFATLEIEKWSFLPPEFWIPLVVSIMMSKFAGHSLSSGYPHFTKDQENSLGT